MNCLRPLTLSLVGRHNSCTDVHLSFLLTRTSKDNHPSSHIRDPLSNPLAILLHAHPNSPKGDPSSLTITTPLPLDLISLTINQPVCFRMYLHQSRPSSHPSSKPTSPSGQPTRRPSRQPSRQPTVQPSKPTYGPTPYPTINGFYVIVIELRFVGINASRALATTGFNTSITSFLANVLNRSPSIFTVLSIYPTPAAATGTVTRHQRQKYHRFRSLRSLLTTTATAAATSSITNSASSILVLVSYQSQNPSTNEMVIALSAGCVLRHLT